MAAAVATLRRRVGGGAVVWGRYLLGARWERRCFSSCPVVQPSMPDPLLLLLPSTPISFSSSSSLATPALRPQLVLPGVLPFGTGAMDLMAVPKKKVSRHKKGIRNGPKALKPVPVIVRCKSCGRVRLPHFYCCSGDRGSSGNSEST